MSVTFGNRRWEVDANGVAQVLTPGLDGPVRRAIPRNSLGVVVAEFEQTVAELTAQRDRIQGRIDELSAAADGVRELQAQATADPPPPTEEERAERRAKREARQASASAVPRIHAPAPERP